ncbi:ABC transporter substrate-binding protein [Haematobacter genomosp. 1]|uniref:ABC transporter substrate-binding protein n=1 Tax=Haematobacter genomosp. 1 TaxID=366618 RepID=UPI001C52E9BE|nr:ABC transporter substrate-binding protein [Haematobacter genomosp. 1]
MLKVGVHPMNLHLRLLSLWPGAMDHRATEFVAYPEGRDTGLLIADGRLHVGGTGSTPPLIAQSEGRSVLYLGASAPRPANGALLVAPESPVRDMGQLKGKRVALIDGSFHTYLLARSLEQAGLQLADVVRCEMSPAASRKALASGEVDVWIAMAPLIDQTIAAGEARLLSLCGSTIPNRSVFWTLAGSGATEAELDGFVAALLKLGEAVAADPEQAAGLLAGDAATPAQLAQWKAVIAGRDWRVIPASAALVAEQQEEADVLHAHGDFAAPLHITAFRPTLAA